MQNPRNARPLRTSGARKAVVATSLVLAGLTMGAGTAGAFPGPGVIQDQPNPPLPPPAPLPFDDAPDSQQPPQGPQDLAAPDVTPPPPTEHPQGSGGSGGAGQGSPQGQGAGASGDTSGVADATTELAAADDAPRPVDGTPGKESDRPAGDDEVLELAAGVDVGAESSSSIPALVVGLVAMVLASAAGLWLLVARRRIQDDAPTVA